jgi:hypothetical protein
MKQHYNHYARRIDRPIPNRRSDFTAVRKKRANDDHASLPLRPSNRKQCLASPKKSMKVKKRSIEDGVVAATDVGVSPALADCGPNMLDDGYFDYDDVATNNDEEAEWRDDGDVIPGVQSARQATEEPNFYSDNDDDNNDDDVLFSKFQLLDENADFNLSVEDDDVKIQPKVLTHDTRVRSMLAAASAPQMAFPRRQEIITAPTLSSSGHLRGLSNEERAKR